MQPSSPKRMVKTAQYLSFTIQYEVLKADTSIRDGKYLMTHKDRHIEKGRYIKGRRVGTWEFKNDLNMVELCYNYTIGQPLQVLPHEGKAYSQDTYPCLYIGSPMVPYFFIMYNVFYPVAERDRKGGGKVKLRIHVSPEGRMVGYDTVESTSEHFSNAVLKAAAKIPKDEWRWAPAMLNGTPVSDDYIMTIVFSN